MRNYLYIPLGGNRSSQSRVLLNLFIVFILSGLWHGAGWNFILWGIYFGLFLVLERIFIRNNNSKGFWVYVGWLYTFIVVVIGWVLFRIEDIDVAFQFIYKMWAFDFTADYIFIYKPDFFIFLIIGLFFSFCTLNNRIKTFQKRFFDGLLAKRELFIFSVLGIAAYMLCLTCLSSGEFNPFIYFKF